MRQTAWNDAKAILDFAEAEGRDLTSVENASYTALKSELDERGAMITKLKTEENRELRFDAATRGIVEQVRPLNGAGGSLEWRDFVGGKSSEIQIPLGLQMAARSMKSSERRDLLLSNTTLVPTEIMSEIMQRLVQQSGVLAAGPRIINTEGAGHSIKLPRISASGTAAQVAEGAAFTESDPTVGSVDFGAYKFGRLLQISTELIEDASFDIARYLGEEMGQSLGLAVSGPLVTGNGTTTIQGIIGSAATGITSGTAVAGVPTVANVLGLLNSLPTQYRAQASWIMAPATLNGLVNILDTTNRSILLPSLSLDVPTTLLGLPVYLDDNVAATGTANKSIWLGDMSRYYAVRYAGPLTVKSSEDFAFASGLITYRVEQRLDGRVMDSSAARVFIGATT